MPKKYSKEHKKGGDKMINWWTFVSGLVGVVGVLGSSPSLWGHWLVGVAFLVLFASSFLENEK